MREYDAVDWSKVQTAYGSAKAIPELLTQLASDDHSVAINAAHELWCSLCHQHAYVSSAALPALPFILAVLDTANDTLTVEILDILLGFLVCVTDGVTHASWIDQLHVAVAKERARFVLLSSSQDENVASFAISLLDAIENSPTSRPEKA